MSFSWDNIYLILLNYCYEFIDIYSAIQLESVQKKIKYGDRKLTYFITYYHICKKNDMDQTFILRKKLYRFLEKTGTLDYFIFIISSANTLSNLLYENNIVDNYHISSILCGNQRDKFILNKYPLLYSNIIRNKLKNRKTILANSLAIHNYEYFKIKYGFDPLFNYIIHNSNNIKIYQLTNIFYKFLPDNIWINPNIKNILFLYTSITNKTMEHDIFYQPYNNIFMENIEIYITSISNIKLRKCLLRLSFNKWKIIK